MKILASILTILILGLSSVPCCSDDSCENEQNQEQHHQDEQNPENCSPFLSCGSCKGFVFVQEACFKSQPEEKTFYKSHDVFNSLSLQEFIALIWQPPRSH